MRSFEIIRENMAATGIDLHPSNQKCQFNIKNLTVLSIMMVGVITTIVYAFCEAHSFEMYVDSAYTISTPFACGVVFTNFTAVTLEVNMLLSNFECIISESKKE